MPSNSFHFHFGNVLYTKTTKEIQSQIDADKPAFLFGNQGPDILFYLKVFRGVNNALGTNVHKSFETQKLIEMSANYIKQNTYHSILPYIYGMLCHYALDKNFHPFVYFREKDNPKFCDKNIERFYHVDFESSLDFVCIEEYMGEKSQYYDSTKHLSISKSTAQEIALFYENVFAPIYDPSLKSNELIKCIRYMKMALKVFDDKNGRKLKLFNTLEKLIKLPGYPRAALRPTHLRADANYMNREHQLYPKYRNMPDQMINLSVDEMFDNAINDALILVSALYNRINFDIPLDDALFAINFAGDIMINTPI
ncbi:MAG: zinc dependent phospholipase C family protein [Christensenellaceae bacterium]|jgi:hypothetical protein|nr:zinc dependent phospholipase C family protein [Christensenellaceae bacterium]